MKELIIDNIIYEIQKMGGVSGVFYELTSRLIEEDSVDIHFVEGKNAIKNFYRKQLPISQSQIIHSYNQLSFVGRFINPRIKTDYPFIFHSSYYRYCNNNNAVNITTVHDFTYEYYQKGLGQKVHMWQKYRALRNSDYIVCISKNTKNDLLKFLPDLKNKRIMVIYNGVSNDYCLTHDGYEDVSIPFKKKSYVVFVGSRVQYKQFELTVSSVSKTKYNLIIVGGKLTEREEAFVLSKMSANRVYNTGYICNKDLNIIYNNAAALVYPSLYEGFGIPVIEAQKAGCPVIAYNGSSIPEIIGETPLLLNNATEENLLENLDLLSDSQLMENVRLAGLENSKRFSWDKMYQEYLNLYKEV